MAAAPELELLKIVPFAGRTADEVLDPFRCKKCGVVGHLNRDSDCIACAKDLKVVSDDAIGMLKMMEGSGIFSSIDQDSISRESPLGASGGPNPKRQRIGCPRASLGRIVNCNQAMP